MIGASASAGASGRSRSPWLVRVFLVSIWSCSIAMAGCAASLDVGRPNQAAPATDAPERTSSDDDGEHSQLQDVYVHVVWSDTVAVRKEIDGYQFWEIRIGLAMRVHDDAKFSSGFQRTPADHALIALRSAIHAAPRKYVTVQDMTGRRLRPAIDFDERWYEVQPWYAPASIAPSRVLSTQDGWTTFMTYATVALGEPPQPGLYRMRLIANSWNEAEVIDWQIDGGWHNFILTEVRGDAGTIGRAPPTDQLPWHNLPEPERPKPRSKPLRHE